MALSSLETGSPAGALLEDACTWRPHRDARDSGLKDAIERGELSVTRLHCGLVGAGRRDADEQGQEVDAVPLLSLARDWIEIRLVDESGAPVPRAAYELRLPNGTMLTGRLDAEGKLYLDDLPVGLCELKLTEEALPRRKPECAVSSA